MSQPLETSGTESTESDVSTSPVTDYTSTEDSKPSGNPAWTELLEAIPAGLHDTIRPYLEKWDRGYQEVATERAQLRQQFGGIDLQRYQTGNQLLDMLDKDPVDLFNKLEHELVVSGKLTPRQAAAAVQELKNQNSQDQNSEDENSYEDPAIKQLRMEAEALRAQQSEFQNYLQRQAEQKETDNFNNYLGTEINRLRTEVGRFDEETVLGFVLQQVEQGQVPNVQQAFDRYAQLVERIRSTPSAGSQAPFVTPASGGLASSGTPGKSFAEMTPQESAAYFKQHYDLATKG